MGEKKEVEWDKEYNLRHFKGIHYDKDWLVVMKDEAETKLADKDQTIERLKEMLKEERAKNIKDSTVLALSICRDLAEAQIEKELKEGK